MRQKTISSRKKNGFSMIDVIFAVLFLFVMLILGVKFIYTSKELNHRTEMEEDAVRIVTNHVEQYQAEPKRQTRIRFHYDKSRNLVCSGDSKATYLLDFESERLKDNLDLLRLRVSDISQGLDEELLLVETKVYLPESRRRVDEVHTKR